MDLGRINEDIADDGASEYPYAAGAIANEHGDIWAAPRTVIPWGKVLLPPGTAEEAERFGWRRMGDFDGYYTRVWRERPC